MSHLNLIVDMWVLSLVNSLYGQKFTVWCYLFVFSWDASKSYAYACHSEQWDLLGEDPTGDEPTGQERPEGEAQWMDVTMPSRGS